MVVEYAVSTLPGAPSCHGRDYKLGYYVRPMLAVMAEKD